MAKARESTLSHCAAEVRRYDRDRWLTLLYAPPERREDLAALYAFALEIGQIRDRVSEPMMGEIRLEWWRETIRAIYAGRPRAHPVVEALARAIGHRPLPQGELLALIDSYSADLYRSAPADMEELIAYADGTGGGLGTLAAAICGATGKPVAAAARAVGRAWTLTGLLRNAAPLATQGRTPLPEAAVNAAGVSMERLCRGPFPDALRPTVAAIAKQAHEAIATARQSRGDLRGAETSPCLLATLAEDHLARLARAGYDPYKANFSRGRLRRLVKLHLASKRGW